MKSVVVTGVSTGIGRATAQVLTRKGFHVFGSLRKPADMDALRTDLGQNFTPFLFDVTDEESVSRAAQIVREQLGGHTLAGLVNNAGIALAGPLLHQPMEEVRQQMEVNVIGPLTVTRKFASLLGTDRSLQGDPGRIVNIGSASGRIGAPFVGAYAASKHALEGLSESLRRELLLYGIDVILIGPGPVVTPMWDKAEASDVTAYAKTDYSQVLPIFRDYAIQHGRRGFPPERVANVVWKALTVKNPRVRYAVVPQRFLNWTLPMALPRRFVDKLIGRRLGLLRK